MKRIAEATYDAWASENAHAEYPPTEAGAPSKEVAWISGALPQAGERRANQAGAMDPHGIVKNEKLSVQHEAVEQAESQEEEDFSEYV